MEHRGSSTDVVDGTVDVAPVHATVDGARVEVADQPRTGAGRAGRSPGQGDVDHQRRAAQPRHRPDDRRRCRPWASRSTATTTELTVSGAHRPRAADAASRLRAGRHRAAVRAAGGRAEHRRSVDLRRRRAGPRPPDRAAARRAARPRRRHRRRRAAVHGPRHRLGAPAARSQIDASASSQFVSGLLLSGAAFTDGLTDRAHRRRRCRRRRTSR